MPKIHPSRKENSRNGNASSALSNSKHIKIAARKKIKAKTVITTKEKELIPKIS